MWVLLIIVLSLDPSPKHKGSVMNFYTTEAECQEQLAMAMKALNLKDSKVTGNCTFKDYITPNKTF
jgi:hypothetical protein